MEQVIKDLGISEQEKIKKLALRVKNDLTPSLERDHSLFYRFLKARDFDIDKAECMLREHLVWRKANQADTILDTFKHKDVFNHIGLSFIGLDKEKRTVHYLPGGRIYIRDFMKVVKLNDYIKYMIYAMERRNQILYQAQTKYGVFAFQSIIIVDLDGLQFSSAVHKSTAEALLRIGSLLQNYYPERLNRIFVINAPYYCTIPLAILSKVLSKASMNKLQFYGQSGWKEVLLKDIDEDVLPAFLGGKRTDPDGDIYCKSCIHRGGTISPNFYLTPEDRTFKDITKVKKVLLQPSQNHKIYVTVKSKGSKIEWEFEASNKYICFGLFLQISGDNIEEVLPMQKIITSDGTETDSYIANSPGTYIIIFDNSDSWWSSNEVQYCITVN